MMFFLSANSQPHHAQFLILNIKGLFESPISPLVYYSEIFLDLQDTGHILFRWLYCWAVNIVMKLFSLDKWKRTKKKNLYYYVNTVFNDTDGLSWVRA